MSLFLRKAVTYLVKPVHVNNVRHGSSISVILVNALENRGGKGEVIDVKRGFARNFLIPRKLAGE